MSARSLALALLVGCAAPGGGKAPGDDTAGGDAGGGSGGGDDTGEVPGPTDEALLRAAIAGEADPQAALTAIAASGGLPVETEAGTYLFACLCDSSAGAWGLMGDHNGWSADVMQATGAMWWIEAEIPSPDGSRYKFTDGAQDIADPLGRRYTYDDFGRISYVRASVAHLERFFAVEGAGLGPRDLRVWVPDGGDFTHLLVAHDGQNLFDPAAIWGGWRLQDSLPDDVLVVGIDNAGLARFDEYTHVPDDLDGTVVGGQADAYAALVQDVILPAMVERYGLPQVVGTMGSSLGGLVSLHLADRDPAAWDMVISLSGTMAWGRFGLTNETMPERYVGAGRRDTAIYLDSGGVSNACTDTDGDGVPDDLPSNDNYCTNLWMRDVLAGEGYVFEDDLWHWHEAGAGHTEAAWAARVWRPLELFAGL